MKTPSTQPDIGPPSRDPRTRGLGAPRGRMSDLGPGDLGPGVETPPPMRQVRPDPVPASDPARRELDEMRRTFGGGGSSRRVARVIATAYALVWAAWALLALLRWLRTVLGG